MILTTPLRHPSILLINSKNMPPKVLKSSAHSCSEALTKLFNNTMNNSKFLNELKLADVTVTLKKDDPTKSKNYRPASLFPTVSKVFERIKHRQMCIFVEIFVFLFRCGYRKGFSM